MPPANNGTGNHEVDILLQCSCIIYERIEGVIFLPNVGEARHCNKHGNTTILRVGYPYWVTDEQQEKIKKEETVKTK
jgi:hypothetical protein